MPVPTDDLRGHVLDRPAEGVGLVLKGLLRQPEVGYRDVAVVVQEKAVGKENDFVLFGKPEKRPRSSFRTSLASSLCR